jgi:methylated-DNA-protein-cysteine methyltransferase-like protein
MKYSEASQDFFQQVYQVCREIPKGRVTTYGAIAKYLGAARSSRVVGWAMNGAHSQSKPVPAQRVVNRNGQLTGKNHFSTPFEMEEKLKLEGILVKNDTIIDFKKHFWDPSIELAL